MRVSAESPRARRRDKLERRGGAVLELVVRAPTLGNIMFKGRDKGSVMLSRCKLGGIVMMKWLAAREKCVCL